MKKLLPIITLASVSLQLFAQTVLYNQDFNGVAAPNLPGDWFATSDQIFTNASSPSSGYAGASGSNNLLSRNCNPNGEVRSFQVDGISSVNFGEINVSFGHRRTNSFTPPVALEWSSDGTNWNGITYNSASAGTTWSLFTSATLPAGAENQPSLSFRWTYTTNLAGSVPCDNFAGNYRIDDFKVTAGLVLPIELLHFMCNQSNKSVTLNWRTSTEISNDFFAVERSADGHNFSEIGRVKGSGTSHAPNDYTFSDKYPLPGLNYYRLRQVDFDGQYSYSHVLTIRTGQPLGLWLYPSPATDMLNVQLEKPMEEAIGWEVFDFAGHLSKAGLFYAENVDYAIDVTELPAGAYVLRVIAGREVTTQRFIKSH